jgi:hypothetical protein
MAPIQADRAQGALVRFLGISLELIAFRRKNAVKRGVGAWTRDVHLALPASASSVGNVIGTAKDKTKQDYAKET